MLVSVSLRSIVHSYDNTLATELSALYLAFPSPYGVSFILIPEPLSIRLNKDIVSVSLRSIVHSYKSKSSPIFPYSPSPVSVSLRSIVHSYYRDKRLET